MSVTVQQWPPVEVPSTSDLANNFAGLLEWVLDECAMAAEKHMKEDIHRCIGQAAVKDSSVLEEVDGCVEVNGKDLAEFTSSPEKFTSPEHNLGEDEAKDDVQNDGMMPIEQDHRSSLHDGNQEAASILKSVTLTDTARGKSLEQAEKKEIHSEVSQDSGQAAPEDKGSTLSRSISASGHDSSISLSKATPNRPNEFESVRSIEVPTKVKELVSSGEPSPLSVAAWVMDTTEAPMPNLVVSKAANASTHCRAIDPETGAFLPVIEQPETRYNDELDLQSEPGWRRSNVTSDMQIGRELKARAKLARRLKERLPTQAQANYTVPEEAESPFPKADCTLRPATDDDIAAILDIVNLERQASREENQKKSSDIKNWEVSKYLNKCRRERRPFIVATAGEDDLLDRSKWPAGADRAYKKYVQYQSMSKTLQPAIIGFAFAMPRQSLDAQDTDIDHSCYITLYVHPSHRNEKYGSALLDRILMSVSPVHRSLIDFGWQCDDAVETYEQIASHNAKQYARVFVEYSEPRDAEYKLMAREKLLRKFGFRQVGHLTCMKSESRAGRRYWKDLLIWELEAQSLENVG
ncbi:Acyl-CoA N-acyltransferase [Beauveria brongniartii RCEF 3172]|uniref:Acyl-CoA N-acyltransferase n=1 Tax=Beauveria brongniartii RCEF 3172 TaxID=1081107 RepID=A0A167JDM2_9HYPO|nr:Acyl-CoA N-acyltransferase [Beauveria brongniartii RCEF 3172]